MPNARHEGEVGRRLRQMRRSYGGWLLETYLARFAVVLAAAAGSALALTRWAGNELRIALLASIVVGALLAAVVLRERAAPVRSLIAFARYLQRSLAGARQDFETALSLEANEFADPVSAAFAQAHRQKATVQLAEVPRCVVRAPRSAAAEALAVVAWCALVVLAVALPERVSEARNAWLRWDGAASRLAGGAARSLRVVSEFTFTIQAPKYTGLEPETVTGAGLLLRAYKGSAVRARVRMQTAVPAVRLALPGGAVAELRAVDGAFAGEFTVTDKGPFALQLKPSDEWIDDGIERAIELVADQPPTVRLLGPADGLTLNPADQLAVRFEAVDDFGFTQAALVVNNAGQEQRFPLPVSETGTRFVAGGRFEVAALASEGAALSYYVEVFDNDAISGPKRGTSAPQKLDVYSPRKNHLALLERQERLLTVVVHALGDAIELPEIFGTAVAPRLAALKQRLGEAAVEFTAIAGALHADPLADASATLKFEDLGARVESQRNETAAYARAVSAGTAAERYAGFRPRSIETAEQIAIELADLLKQSHMNDLMLTAGDLQRAREDLRRLIEEYKKNPKAETLAAMRQKIAQIKQLMQELAERQMAMASLPDEFLNADAYQKANEANPAGQLDDLEKLLNGDDPERALAEAEKFERSLNEMLANLERAGQSASQQANSDAYQKLNKALQEVSELEAGQRKLAQETQKQAARRSEQQSDSAADAKRKLAQELNELADETKALHDKSAMSTLWNRGFSYYAPQAAAEIRRAQQAVGAGDWPAARQTVQRTESHLRSMQTQADFEQQAGFGGGLTKELHQSSLQAADHAAAIRKLMESPGGRPGETMQPLESAQSKLQERLQKLKQKLDPKEGQGPPMPKPSRRALDGGEQAMGQAREKMRGNQAEEASLKAEEAADKLAEARKELEKAKREMEQASQGQGQSRGMRAGSGVNEKVEIPHTVQSKAGRREEVLKGMREGLPKAYQDLNKKYYDKLVK